MTIVTAFQNGEIVKKYKIRQDIFSENYIILVDTPRYEKKNSPVVSTDGKSDRLFRTHELAAEFVFTLIDRHMAFGVVDKYTVERK